MTLLTTNEGSERKEGGGSFIFLSSFVFLYGIVACSAVPHIPSITHAFAPSIHQRCCCTVHVVIASSIEHRSSIIDHRLVVGGWRWCVDQSYQNCTVQCTSLHFINFTSSLSLTVVHSSLTHSAHSLSVTVSEASVAQHSFYCLFPPSFHSSVYLNLHSLIPTYFQNLFTYCTCIFFHTLAETVSGRKRVSQ